MTGHHRRFIFLKLWLIHAIYIISFQLSKKRINSDDGKYSKSKLACRLLHVCHVPIDTQRFNRVHHTQLLKHTTRGLLLLILPLLPSVFGVSSFPLFILVLSFLFFFFFKFPLRTQSKSHVCCFLSGGTSRTNCCCFEKIKKSHWGKINWDKREFPQREADSHVDGQLRYFGSLCVLCVVGRESLANVKLAARRGCLDFKSGILHIQLSELQPEAISVGIVVPKSFILICGENWKWLVQAAL